MRLALRLFGSGVVRELSAWLGLLAWGSATRFGAGRHWDRRKRRAWRSGLRDHARRRFPHQMLLTPPVIAACQSRRGRLLRPWRGDRR